MNIVIIGNGIAGITAARYIRKHSDHSITVVSPETEYFYSRPALMYVYMGHLKFEHTKPYEDWFWKKNRIDVVHDYALTVNHKEKKVLLQSGNILGYDKLIMATGSQMNKFGWKGQDLAGVQGLYSKQDLDLMERNTRNISRGIVVGGGLIGIEVAEMLHSRNIPVTMLVRESSYWNSILPAEESAMITRHIRHQGIELRLETELKEILSDSNGRVRGVRTSKGDEITTEFVALTAGVRPNIDLAQKSSIPTNRGILVNSYFETQIDDIYAVGDCAEIVVTGEGRNQIEQLWYTGEMHGETVASSICKERTEYNRGILFNSAKFFDIEYHTYGSVNQNTVGEKSIYWEHPDRRRSIRIVYNNNQVIGFNNLGVRYRHKICEQWIAEKRSIEYVLEHLSEANFDPEFFMKFEPEVIALYNKKNGKSLTLTKTRGLFGYKKFLSTLPASI
ncbi:MAG: FAD-dependent oxidoreductase [Ignavibacteriae bacterium]|nr:FAD-dependent oxidoreductase [Ignavibacteriota bacterium]